LRPQAKKKEKKLTTYFLPKKLIALEVINNVDAVNETDLTAEENFIEPVEPKLNTAANNSDSTPDKLNEKHVSSLDSESEFVSHIRNNSSPKLDENLKQSNIESPVEFSNEILSLEDFD